jgi:probable HAF family extracellular repeat protein
MKRVSIVLISAMIVLAALSGAYAVSYNFTSLTYPGASWTSAADIGNEGKIVGQYTDAGGVYHGFSLSGGVYTSLTYPGASRTLATGIGSNGGGTIAGWYADAGGLAHGFSLSGGVYTPLNYPGALSTAAYDINNQGTIVGYYTDAAGQQNAFSFSGGVYTPLTYPGASLTNAYGINDEGVIVGLYTDAGGTHGFLAIPVPEATLATGPESSGGGGGSGCFIATAAYGSYFHPFVTILKSFRDKLLMLHPLGQSFVACITAYIAPDSEHYPDQYGYKISSTDTPPACCGLQLSLSCAGADSSLFHLPLVCGHAVHGETKITVALWKPRKSEPPSGCPGRR